MSDSGSYKLWLFLSYVNLASSAGMALCRDWKFAVWLLLAVIYRLIAECYKRRASCGD